MNDFDNYNARHGVFTISLDFELYWGVRDKRSIEQYKENLLGVKRAISEMLRLFRKNDIHATWATVGFLFCDDTAALKRNLPLLKPSYTNEKLSPYKYIASSSDLESVYHFSPEIIAEIQRCPGQEVGTHTFSHYYCLEDGQSLLEFTEDIRLAKKIAKNKGVDLKSIIFPRNQWNSAYLSVLKKLGIECYRGNESSWLYRATGIAGNNKLRRACRLIDSYINLSGHNTYDLKDCTKQYPYNFPSSRFLRPFNSKLSAFDKLRLSRIKNSMDDAAINHRLFHLWWHPHNFGTNTDQNMEFLSKIIEHYNLLKRNHAMESFNMADLCLLIKNS